jgi:hypothetical protein
MSDDWWATPAGVQTVLREEIEIRNDRIEELEAKLAKEIEISNQRGNHIEFALLPQTSDLQFQLKDVKAELAKAVGLVDDNLEWGARYGEALAGILQRLAELEGESDEQTT